MHPIAKLKSRLRRSIWQTCDFCEPGLTTSGVPDAASELLPLLFAICATSPCSWTMPFNIASYGVAPEGRDAAPT